MVQEFHKIWKSRRSGGLGCLGFQGGPGGLRGPNGLRSLEFQSVWEVWEVLKINSPIPTFPPVIRTVLPTIEFLLVHIPIVKRLPKQTNAKNKTIS